MFPRELLFSFNLEEIKETDVRRFTALIMRLMLMYSEKTYIYKSTKETQEDIDRAIASWGLYHDLVVLDQVRSF